MLTDLSIVVLSYNRREELLPNLKLLCALRAQTGFELIVVDNASSDGTPEELSRLQQEHGDIVVILSDRNLGVAAGRNLGWAAAKRAFILNLDDDARIELHAIAALCRAAAASPDIGIVTPRVVNATTGEGQNGYPDQVREPANFHGACHLVRRAVWERIGELDPACSFGGEELDYSIRARAAGYSTIYLAEVTVKHNNVVRTGTDGRWRHEQWLYNYSRVLFKHFPLSRAFVLACRRLISHLASAIAAHGPAIAPSLIAYALRGAVAGRGQYVALPEAALRFYANDALLPDFGNIPLRRKLAARLMHSRAPAS